MATPRFLSALAALAAVVAIAVLVWRTQGADRALPLRDAPGKEAHDPIPMSESSARGVVPGHFKLTVRVVRDDGQPAEGQLYWVPHRDVPRSPSWLSPETGVPLPPAARAVTYERNVSLEVPAGHWTWIRATAHGMPALAGYARVPPLHEDRELILRLSPSRRTLHVFVLREDFATPAPDAHVRVLFTDIRSGPGLTPVATASTDEGGYVAVRDLLAGAYLICAPGALPTDPPPYTTRVLLPQGMGTQELPCTVIMREARSPVRIRVQAAISPLPGLPPKLLFRGVGEREGEVSVVPGTVRSGDQTLSTSLPSGRWTLLSLPLGRITLFPEQAIYDVTDGEALTLSLRAKENEVRTELTLKGLQQTDFPVRVLPRPIDRPIPGDVSLWFVGPNRWRIPTLTVAAPSYPCRLIASGRSRVWISENELQLTGGRVEARLIPATRLHVVWPIGIPGARQGCTVTIRHALGTDSVTLVPRLLPNPGGSRPELRGSLVVPRGVVEATCWAADGEQLWERRVEVIDRSATIEIERARPR